MSIRTNAFTLIEVLASTALAALLVVAVLGVSQSTAGHQRAMTSVQHTPVWVDRALERIAWDLQHARSYAVTNDRLTLAGYGSLDEETSAPTHRPVQVEYRLRDGMLTRSQTALDAITTRSTQRELLGAGVSRFELAVPESSSQRAHDGVGAHAAVAKSAAEVSSGERGTRIPMRDPAPDPMTLVPGLKPLDASDLMDVTIAWGDDTSGAGVTRSRSLIVGAGP